MLLRMGGFCLLKGRQTQKPLESHRHKLQLFSDLMGLVNYMSHTQGVFNEITYLTLHVYEEISQEYYMCQWDVGHSSSC